MGSKENSINPSEAFRLRVKASPCRFICSSSAFLPCFLHISLLSASPLDFCVEVVTLAIIQTIGGILAPLRCTGHLGPASAVFPFQKVSVASALLSLWTQTDKRKGLHSWARSWRIVTCMGMSCLCIHRGTCCQGWLEAYTSFCFMRCIAACALGAMLWFL